MATNYGINADNDLEDLQEIIFGPGPGNDQQDLSISPIFDIGIQASVEILDLKDLYYKYQKKKLFSSEQRVLDGKINFIATASAQIAGIQVLVQRCPDVALKLTDEKLVGPVQLHVSVDKTEFNKTHFSVDLDSVYKTDDGDLVYFLHKVEVEERNIWHLIINLEFIDGTMKPFQSQQFRIRTKPRVRKNTDSQDTEQPDAGSPQTGTKRQRLDSEERQPLLSPNGHPGNYTPLSSPLSDTTTSPGGGYGSSSGRGSTYNNNEGSPGGDGASSNRGSTYCTSEVLTDYLEAQRANIKILKVTNMICTPNADIAYHLKLKRGYTKKAYMEGDIVGFFEEDGETTIEKLTHNNAASARMAGVISRSAYLYGNLPEDGGEETDSVCVIGIVKVKVMGPVQNGEKVYASFGTPGLAVPESSLSLVPATGRTPTLLGQALEKSQPRKLNDVTLVKCFVSIVLGIQSQHVSAAVSEVRDSLDKNITDRLRQARNKSRKVWLRNGIIIFIILALVGGLLFEVFCPGSAFRYWQCQRGCIPGHKLRFVYLTTDYQVPTVNGIEFEWEKLKDKLGLQFDKMSGVGIHYYLNIDRCAFGGTVSVASWLDHHRQVRGAEVLL